jgi:type II secretory pathway pseudopilin PulG
MAYGDTHDLNVRPADPDRQAGLTLIEIVAALGILAITLTLVMGSGVQLADRWSEEGALHAVKRDIAALQPAAFLSATPLRWEDAPPASVRVPEGWRISADPAIEFLPSGLCTGGVVTLLTRTGRRHELILSPPDCNPLVSQQVR